MIECKLMVTNVAAVIVSLLWRRFRTMRYPRLGVSHTFKTVRLHAEIHVFLYLFILELFYQFCSSVRCHDACDEIENAHVANFEIVIAIHRITYLIGTATENQVV